LSKLIEKIVDIVFIKIGAWIKKKIADIKTRLDNKAVIEQAQEAETDEELESAAKNISDRFNTD